MTRGGSFTRFCLCRRYLLHTDRDASWGSAVPTKDFESSRCCFCSLSFLLARFAPCDLHLPFVRRAFRAFCQAVRPATDLKTFLGNSLGHHGPFPPSCGNLDSGWEVREQPRFYDTGVGGEQWLVVSPLAGAFMHEK